MSVRAENSRTSLVVDRASHIIRLTRYFDAAPAAIFQAWTQPEQVTCWWDPSGERLAACEIDLRVGGSFKFVTRSHPEMPFSGIYREIASPQRLVFGSGNTSSGRVLLHEDSGGTRMTVEIQCGSAEELEQFLRMGIDKGTARTLDNLVNYIAARTSAR
jgi:uncharacterized protein YndB with AHSA1/START domain